MESKLDRIKAILDEEEQPEWEDISEQVEAEVDYNTDHILVYLSYCGETFGLFDLNGFSFMSGVHNFKVEPHHASASEHDNGGIITWFKVYKRIIREV